MTSLLINRDLRANSPTISDLYDWPEMHHIHCVARAAYNGVQLSIKALGSIIVLPTRAGDDPGFDYVDYFPGRGMMLRSGEIGILCVLNDCCGALNCLVNDLRRINRRLSPMQCREL